MALAFRSSATGNPINTVFQVAPQTTADVPAITGFDDFRAFGGPTVIAPQRIDRQVINTGGAPLATLDGKDQVTANPFSIGDIDPDNLGLLHFLCNLFNKYKVTDNTTWYRWQIDLGQTTSTASDYLTLNVDNDVNPRMRLHNAQITGAAINAADGDNLAIEFPWHFGYYDYWGAVTQTAGAGSTLPIFTRTASNNWATTDQDLYFKIVTAASLVTNTKVGAGSAYSNSQTMAAADTPMRLQDEGGYRIGRGYVQATTHGDFGEQVRVFFNTASPTLTDADIFKCLQNMAAWSPSLGTERPMAVVRSALYAGGTERVYVDAGIELEWTDAQVINSASGFQDRTVERGVGGFLNARINLTRRITDLDFQKALQQREQLSFVLDCYGKTEIGASGRPYRFTIVCPTCDVEGELFDTQPGGGERDEAPTLIPATGGSLAYDGNTYNTSHVHINIENSISSL